MALGRVWGAGKVLSDTCLAAQNQTGRFVGTAFVARDMMRIVDTLGEDGMLRYWGQCFPSGGHVAKSARRFTFRIRYLIWHPFGGHSNLDVP